MEPSNQKNVLTVPLAIVVAGLLIAGAIFFSRGGATVAGIRVPERTTAIGAATAEPQSGDALAVRPLDAEDHIRGNPSAPVVIVEYSDTECPFCKRFHGTLQQIMSEYGKSGKVAWVYRHFPLAQLHSKAQKEAEALECAAELGGNAKFWEYADRIFEVTPSNDGLDPAALPRIAREIGLDETEFRTCHESGRQAARVQSDYEDGVTVGVNGTPHSVLALESPVSAEVTKALLELMEPYRGPQGEIPLSFSQDGLRIGMSGALPLQTVKAVIDTLLK